MQTFSRTRLNFHPATADIWRLRSSSGAALLISLVFLAYNYFSATGKLNIEALAFLACFLATCVSYGRVLRAAIKRWVSLKTGIAFDFLVGFFIANTLLFIVSLASPFGMKVNGLAVFVISSFMAWLLRGQHDPAPAASFSASSQSASVWATLISAIAATLWSQQAQTVLVSDGLVTFQVWRDAFIHMREISAFAQAFGMGTLQDIKLAGSPTAIYHFASYISPAAAAVYTEASAIDLYGGFQLPLGIFLTGLAAFCLASTLWGVWPALAATVAAVVLPDAYEQGFQNRYLGYHFISQVNLGMLYGIACVALAWIFMILGCRHGKIGLVVLGYVFLAICAVYKAHLFVANAFLILMYPTVFFHPVNARVRTVVAVLFIAIFVGTIWMTQSHPRIPLIRLDGSNLTWYIKELIIDFDAGRIKNFFASRLESGKSKMTSGLYGALLISVCTFGLWVILAPVAWWRVRKHAAKATLLFPVLMALNYMVMSLGMAMDEKLVGTPDELRNRPLVWAYFTVALWTAAAIYHSVWGDEPPRKSRDIGICAVALASALAALGHFSKDAQAFPARGYVSFADFNSVPVCMVRSAEFIRRQSAVGDIVQDSENDANFAFTAMTERQLYYGGTGFGGGGEGYVARGQALRYFLEMNDPAQIRAFAQTQAINWYMLQPATRTNWPDSLLDRPAFQCKGFRVYKL